MFLELAWKNSRKIGPRDMCVVSLEDAMHARTIMAFPDDAFEIGIEDDQAAAGLECAPRFGQRGVEFRHKA